MRGLACILYRGPPVPARRRSEWFGQRPLRWQALRQLGHRKSSAQSQHSCKTNQRFSKRCTMPVYEFKCTACDHRFDVKMGINDDPPTSCPECGEAVKKVFSPVGIAFKGSGFYKNDSRGSKSKSSSTSSTSSTSSSESSSTGSSDSSSTAKPEKKSSDSKPSTKADSKASST